MVSSYFVYYEGSFQKTPLREIVGSNRENPPQRLWSARLSTGVFGLPTCNAGNRGPKESNEVLLSLGNEGLNQFVDLGFISCSVCHPEQTPNFWETVKDKVTREYGLSSLDAFLDKNILPFDARRVTWETVLPITRKVPGRIYLPKDLSEQEVRQFQERFTRIGFTLPPVGYYNPSVPQRFTEYQI